MLNVNISYPLPSFDLTINQSFSMSGITGIWGNSAAGKSTLLHIIAGLKQPTSGQIVLKQQPLFDSTTGINVPCNQRKIGIVFQHPRLFPHLNVLQNLTFAQNQVKTPKLSLTEIIERFNIISIINQRVDQLSGGQQQRVALARGILAEPQLLLLDEPLTALDNQSKFHALQQLVELSKQLDLPLFYVSHNLTELAYIADNLLVLSCGQVSKFGDKTSILAEIQHQDLTQQHTLLNLMVTQHHTQFGLTELRLSTPDQAVEHSFFMPLQTQLHVNETVPCVIYANDISVSLTTHQQSSVVNQLPGTIRKITPLTSNNIPSVLLDIDCASACFYVKISSYSLQKLALSQNQAVAIQFKASALKTLAQTLKYS